MNALYCTRCRTFAERPALPNCVACGTPLVDAEKMILVPPSELEELVGALELAAKAINAEIIAFGGERHTPRAKSFARAFRTAAKFRAKFLKEGK